MIETCYLERNPPSQAQAFQGEKPRYTQVLGELSLEGDEANVC